MLLRCTAAVFLAVGIAAADKAEPDADHGYNEDEALTYAYLSNAAYCGAPRFSREALEAWKCGPSCSSVPGVVAARQVRGDTLQGDASAVVGWFRGKCLVAFRGTVDSMGWLQDLKSGWHAEPAKHGINCSHGNKSCWVGAGWMSYYGTLRKYLLGNLSAIDCHPGSALVVTGHSLGAAAAQIAMFDLAAQGYKIRRSYVFGSPRTGDTTWVKAFKERLGAGKLFRVVFRWDPVPHLPMLSLGFYHSPVEVFYNGNTSKGFTVCRRRDRDAKCSGRYRNLAGLIEYCLRKGQHCDHLEYMKALKTFPMNGQRCAKVPPAEIHV